MSVIWTYDNRLSIVPPRNPKKITGTRFASILGKNPWKTPFGAWCEITRTYEEPFEDSIYTKAGKIIEPEQARYIQYTYNVDIVSPTDVYGPNYFKVTKGDFFPEFSVLGGMWDYLEKDILGAYDAVFEMKTTKRSEDWLDDIPEYYALQAALYAYMLGVDQVYMVASFLEDENYRNPGAFVANKDNTVVFPFKVSERYPKFDSMYEQAVTWWKDHVLTGISPQYDEKADASILSELRTQYMSPDVDIQDLIAKAETLKDEIDRVSASVSAKQNELKKILCVIKEYMVEQFKEGDKKVILRGRYEWCLTKSTRMEIDRAAMELDGILEKYNTIKSDTYKLTANLINK